MHETFEGMLLINSKNPYVDRFTRKPFNSGTEQDIENANKIKISQIASKLGSKKYM